MSKLKPKKLRTFGESFKIEKVRMLENCEITPTELRFLYNISYSTIYRWRSKYGTLPANEKLVVEKKSDSYKVSEFLKKIKELETMVGRQAMEISFLNDVIAEASKVYETDIKKKFSKQ